MKENDKDQVTTEKAGQVQDAYKSIKDAVTLTVCPAIINFYHELYKKLYSLSMGSGINLKIFGFHSLIILIRDNTPA
jgi:hypothetical protein